MYRPKINIRKEYDRFNENIVGLDCGKKCAPFNPSGKPFCCDICEAIPAAYDQEWNFLRAQTDLWHFWNESDCLNGETSKEIEKDLAKYQVLIACKGPQFCQRNYRAISCRQFPFFPYITNDFRFIGMAYEWHFESKCWVINHLQNVNLAYRNQFITFYDDLFSLWPDDLESYAVLSNQMRVAFRIRKKRIPVLHRNGGYYLLSPKTERLMKVDPENYQKYGVYKQEP